MSDDQHRKAIERRLGLVLARIRRLQWLRGGLVVGSVFLGGLLLAMAADLVFAPLPQVARWVIFGVWVVAVLAAVWLGVGPLSRPIGLVQIARWLENRHPEIEERLSTALELSGDQRVSPELLAALLEAADADAGKVDARLEVHAGRTTRKWRWLAASFAVVIIGALVAMPDQTGRLLVRAIAPFSKTGNALAAYFELKPGDLEVLEGDPVEIAVSYNGPSSDLELVMDLADGSRISQPLAEVGGELVYQLDPARESFVYKARAGRAESDAYAATVWPLPRLVEPRLVLDFPDYTGLAPREAGFGQAVEAVIGTTMRFEAELNTAVESAWLTLGEGRHDGEVEASVSGGRVTFEWTLSKQDSGEVVVWLRHRLGRDIEAFRFEIQALEDRAPAVVLLSPARDEIRVRSDELLRIKYEVIEDFGLAGVSLEVEAGKKGGVEVTQALPEKQRGFDPPRFRGSVEVAVGSMIAKLDGAREFHLRIKARDARPPEMDGPGRGESKWLIVRIDDRAETLARQELFAEHSDTRETLEKAMRKTREARDKMNQVRDKLVRAEREDWSDKTAAEAQERLAEAEEMLAELASRMEERIHAAKAGEVRETSELLTAARENFEEVPLQDAEQPRGEKFDKAKQAADEALAKLETLHREVDREHPQIEDLARIEDLAQRQRELARQAAELSESPDDEWRRRQEQVKQELMQEIRQQPEALAEALRRQAEQAKALAEEAREMAEAQDDLERVSAELAVEPEAQALAESDLAAAQAAESEALAGKLAEALKKEQAAIAFEAREQVAAARQERNGIADILPQSADAAQAAKEELDRGMSDAAAAEAGLAAASMEAAAAQAKATPATRTEELAALAERQSAVAAATEALAAGDVGEALAQIQARTAAEAVELAREIDAIPELVGSRLGEAAGRAESGQRHAQAAAARIRQADARAAASENSSASENFAQAAGALDQASAQLAEQATQAAAREANPNKAPLGRSALAEAVTQAARSAESRSPGEAAEAASQAAQALAQAARQGRAQMEGRRSPPQPGQPAQPDGMPGEDSDGLQRPRQADPGVPPQLARLGISAEDWAKIRSTLTSEVGAGGRAAVPEDYQGLVKDYFQSMAEGQ